MAEAVKLYGGIDEIFSTDEELKNLLTRAIGDPASAKDDMEEEQFINLLQNTQWYKTNSGPIRQRGFEKRQYDALVKKLKTDDPQYKAKIEELNRTSAYGRGLQDVKTEDMVINFDTSYTKISCDATSSYFNMYMNGLEPERYYKVLIRTTLADGESFEVDNNLIFKVVR